MVGETVGKYRMLEAIGRGGVGTVYRARDEEAGRDVAIKVLNTATVDAVQIRRFETEAVALSRLAHPGIARILDVFEHDRQRLMVMDLLDGETLDHMVRARGPLLPARAATLIAQALSTLGDAHKAGIIHRDIKPGNLMLTAGGPLKILDFGVALVAGAERLTEAGLLVGTPAYMAPEQVTGEPVDARTDVYSMGLVLYYLVTAKLPFEGRTPALVAQARVTSAPEPARTHIHALPAWIEQALARALERQPADRFQTADQFRVALEDGIRNNPVKGPGIIISSDAETVAMPVPDFARLPRPPGPPAAGRTNLLVILAIVVAVIVLLVLVR
ncbi:MAG TPA: serine/threonine-protein kinase [Vicinamibacterales bacterium]|nr:serine/threonine-protein kinase [Vicinamibacterales bacterium]